MRGINRVFLLGNVGQDPVVRHTNSGRAVCDLSIATHRAVRSGDTWSEEVDWHRVRLWEQKAELALRYVTRGSVIAVEGQLRTEQWNDAQGLRRQRTYVQVEQLQLLPGRPREERREGEDEPIPALEAGAAQESAEIPF